MRDMTHYMCDMTHSYVWHDSSTCVTHVSIISSSTTLPIRAHLQTPASDVWHDSFICVTGLIQMCDTTHSYVWHDSVRSSSTNLSGKLFFAERYVAFGGDTGLFCGNWSENAILVVKAGRTHASFSRWRAAVRKDTSLLAGIWGSFVKTDRSFSRWRAAVREYTSLLAGIWDSFVEIDLNENTSELFEIKGCYAEIHIAFRGNMELFCGSRPEWERYPGRQSRWKKHASFWKGSLYCAPLACSSLHLPSAVFSISSYQFICIRIGRATYVTMHHSWFWRE